MAERRIRPQPRVVPARRVEEHQGSVSVEADVSVRGERRGGAHRETTVENRKFVDGQEPAHVRVANGLTVSMGNFEFLRLDVSVSLPCLPSEVETTYERAAMYASEFLANEQTRWASVTTGANNNGRRS